MCIQYNIAQKICVICMCYVYMYVCMRIYNLYVHIHKYTLSRWFNVNLVQITLSKFTYNHKGLNEIIFVDIDL